MDAAEKYRQDFGYDPTGDVTTVNAIEVPERHILCAGFPSQSFSVDGERRGMADPHARVVYAIPRILATKRPGAFILQNVDRLLHANKRWLY